MEFQWSWNALSLLASVVTLIISMQEPNHAEVLHFDCRAASISKRSEANDRILFEILLGIYIYIYTTTDSHHTVQVAEGDTTIRASEVSALVAG